jgi:TM2 domain-containing membrane protein YozV
MFCRNCGAQTDEGAQFCIRCGADLRETASAAPGEMPPPPSGATEYPPPPGATPAGAAYAMPGDYQPKSKLAAALLAIFLGWIGIHRFYLGYTTIGIIQIIVGIVTCGIASSIWGIVEGILILVGNINKDANGVPLRD